MIPCGLSLGATITSATVFTPREGGMAVTSPLTKDTDVNSTRNTSSSSGALSCINGGKNIQLTQMYKNDFSVVTSRTFTVITADCCPSSSSVSRDDVAKSTPGVASD